jgi:hypothetical protein
MTKIVASLTTIPSRIRSLKETVNSILPNVDFLHVFLNGYEKVPPFLNDEKIIVARSQDYGDNGDANKFFWCDKVNNCYHFFCDDDIRYTRKYFTFMMSKVDQYKRKAVVGLGGASFNCAKKSFINYYRSRTHIHASTMKTGDEYVHLLCTGIMCFYASDMCITTNIFDYSHPNMCDVWFAVVGKKQKIPFVRVQYPGDIKEYMIDSDLVDAKQTIYHNSKNNISNKFNTADMQTKIIKASYPWVLNKV